MRARTLRSLVPLVALLVTANSCGEQSAPTAPAASPQASLLPLNLDPLTQPVTGLLGGTLDLLHCTVAQTAIGVKLIGPSGGTIAVGPHRLTIPRGALTAPTLIEGIALPGPVRQVAFFPQGLRFRQSTSLRLDYSGCANTRNPLRVVYLSNQGSILEVEPSTDDRSTHVVTASIRHFSSYAIAY